MPDKRSLTTRATEPVDSLVSRRTRLQERLNEIDAQGSRELLDVMKIINRAKRAFRLKKP